MRLTTVLRWTASGSFAAVILMWIAAVFGPFMVGWVGSLAGGLMLVMLFALAALGCAATLEQGRCMPVMRSGIAAATVAAVGWFTFRFLVPALNASTEAWWVGVLTPVTSWTGLCTVTALVMLRRRPSAVGVWTGRVTIACAAALAAAVLPAVWLEGRLGRVERTLERGLGILAVVVVLGLVVTLILARLRQLEGADDEEHIRLDFTARCPRCELRQELVTGGDACSGCGLRIKVIVP